MSAESRKFNASLLMLIILCGLIGYLTFIPVPETNREIIITVLSILLGGGAAAMPNLFGSKDAETDKLKLDNAKLRIDFNLLKAEFDTLKSEYDRITEMLIQRHIVRKRKPAIKVAN